MLVEESLQERVMVFVDLRNIMSSDLVERRRKQNWETDFVTLVRQLAGPRRLVGAYAFDTLRKDDQGFVYGLSLVRALRYQGFRVIAPTDEPEETGAQKEADVMLATELLMQAFHDSYDTAIVVSGDRDFVPAVKAVQSMGKRVEVAALRGTYTPRLVESVDRFHVMDEVAFFRPLEVA
jgi:uncharacterized LabA/DUF88 family protein